jgi:large subunit ribosomal protein L21
MYAVIETGGKQYRVEVGTELAVELLEVEAGQEITLERVLLVADGDEAAIGRPVVDGATVSATVLRNDRADKVISFKYKPKARRRVKKGHRQEQTVLRVTDVTLNGKSAADEARKIAEAKKTERQRLEEVAATQAAADAALAATLAAKTAEAVEAAPEEAEAPKKVRSRAAKADAPAADAADPTVDAPAADEADPAVDAVSADAPAADEADPAAKPKRTRAAKKED